jgi:PAS domain S-box-containing protein
VNTPLRVLLLEDSAADADLLVLALRRAGFDPEWERVEDREAYAAALATRPDIVLADFRLPQFNAIDALHVLRQAGGTIPVIVVSGVLNEESCVEALRHGAVDYLIKDRLSRLGPAVRHALDQRRLVGDRRRAQLASERHERLFRAAFDNAPIGMAVTTVDGDITEVNPALARMTACPSAQLRGRPLVDLVAAEDRPLLAEHVRALAERRPGAASQEIRLRHANGGLIWAHHSASLLDGPEPAERHVVHQLLDITGRREAERALQRQAEQLSRSNAELQELDRLKNQFVATVSHELRTPLSSICGYTELLVDGEVGALNPAEKRIVDIIDRNGRRLLALIEDLLTFSRADAGTLTLNLAEVNFADLVAHVRNEIEPMAGKAGVTVRMDVQPGQPTISADPIQLERALANLLTNAIKFSPDGGVVVITAAHDPSDVTVTISDNGIGIPAHEQAELFQRFYRSSAAQSREIPGTGLGLAITKAIVEAHGGSIALDSSPGRGTTVTLRLPHESPPPA